MLVAETREHLQHLVNELERVCNRMGLKINVFVVKNDQKGNCEVCMSREEMKEVDKFNYLGYLISTDGVMREEVYYRVLEGRNVWMMLKLWKKNMISREVK